MGVDSIQVDYEAVQSEAYYQTLAVQDRLLEVLELTYAKPSEMARAINVSPAQISQARTGKSLCKNMQRLANMVKAIDSNLLYVLCGEEKYKYESYININCSCQNLIRTYKERVYKYVMPRSLSVLMCRIKDSSQFSIRTIYSFSLIYNKPVWWLIQDEALPMVYPETRRVQCPI